MTIYLSAGSKIYVHPFIIITPFGQTWLVVVVLLFLNIKITNRD